MSEPGVDIVVNGTFEDDTSWTWGSKTGLKWEWSPSYAKGTATNVVGFVNLTQGFGASLDHGSVYKITFTITLFTGSGGAANLVVLLGGTPAASPYTSVGTYSVYITAGATNDNLVFRLNETSTGLWGCWIDDVSCKKVVVPTPYSPPTADIVAVNATTMVAAVELVNTGGDDSCDMGGVAWSKTTVNPTRADSYSEVAGTYIANDYFEHTILPLDPNTFYYFTFYFHNGVGYGYSDAGYFTTLTARIILSKLKCSKVKFT